MSVRRYTRAAHAAPSATRPSLAAVLTAGQRHAEATDGFLSWINGEQDATTRMSEHRLFTNRQNLLEQEDADVASKAVAKMTPEQIAELKEYYTTNEANAWANMKANTGKWAIGPMQRKNQRVQLFLIKLALLRAQFGLAKLHAYGYAGMPQKPTNLEQNRLTDWSMGVTAWQRAADITHKMNVVTHELFSVERGATGWEGHPTGGR